MRDCDCVYYMVLEDQHAALAKRLEEAEREGDEQVGVVASLGAALKKLSFMAQTAGGTAGRDEGLVAGIDEAERVLSLPGISAALDRVTELVAENDALRKDAARWDAVRAVCAFGDGGTVAHHRHINVQAWFPEPSCTTIDEAADYLIRMQSYAAEKP